MPNAYKGLSCTQCKLSISTKKKRRVHRESGCPEPMPVLSNTDKHEYGCLFPQCGWQTWKTESKFREHWERMHPGFVYCRPCLMVFGSDEELLGHYRDEPCHPGCPLGCGMYFFDITDAIEHYKTAHPNAFLPMGTDSSATSEVDETLPYTGQSPNGCLSCRKEFPSENALQNHYKARHPTCAPCDIGFPDEAAYDEHFAWAHAKFSMFPTQPTPPEPSSPEPIKVMQRDSPRPACARKVDLKILQRRFSPCLPLSDTRLPSLSGSEPSLAQAGDEPSSPTTSSSTYASEISSGGYSTTPSTPDMSDSSSTSSTSPEPVQTTFQERMRTLSPATRTLSFVEPEEKTQRADRTALPKDEKNRKQKEVTRRARASLPRKEDVIRNSEPVTTLAWCCQHCLREPEDPVTTMCGHIFCHSCIIQEISKTLQCPKCKKVMLIALQLP